MSILHFIYFLRILMVFSPNPLMADSSSMLFMRPFLCLNSITFFALPSPMPLMSTRSRAPTLLISILLPQKKRSFCESSASLTPIPFFVSRGTRGLKKTVRARFDKKRRIMSTPRDASDLSPECFISLIIEMSARPVDFEQVTMDNNMHILIKI